MFPVIIVKLFTGNMILRGMGGIFKYIPFLYLSLSIWDLSTELSCYYFTVFISGQYHPLKWSANLQFFPLQSHNLLHNENSFSSFVADCLFVTIMKYKHVRPKIHFMWLQCVYFSLNSQNVFSINYNTKLNCIPTQTKGSQKQLLSSIFCLLSPF